MTVTIEELIAWRIRENREETRRYRAEYDRLKNQLATYDQIFAESEEEIAALEKRAAELGLTLPKPEEDEP